MSTTKDLDQLLQGFIDNGLPGCGMEVAKKGEVIYRGYFGYSDIEKKTKITENSVFRMASMSKIPLYTVLMMLYEQGRFLMTDPISDYLPEWKEMKKWVRESDGTIHIVPTKRPILIKDVMTMKCGLPYCNFKVDAHDPTMKSMVRCMEPLWEKGHYTLREHVQAMSGAILSCDPGTQWIYGFSSELAAALVEVICKASIDDVFQELLFDPLEMKNTRSHYFGDIEERMVTQYHKNENGIWEASDFLDDKHKNGPEHEAGWGRLFSTVHDHTNLMQMLSNGGEFQGKQIMGRKTIDLMRTNNFYDQQPPYFTDTYNQGYGYGYGVRTLVDKSVANHNGSLGAFGWTGGFGTWAEADPEEGVSIVYMHNIIPNEEVYYHTRVRNAAYGLID